MMRSGKLSSLVVFLAALAPYSVGLSCDGKKILWSYDRVEQTQVDPIVEPLLSQTFTCSGGSPNTTFQLSLCNATGGIIKLETGKPLVVLGERDKTRFGGDVAKQRLIINYQPEGFDCAKEKRPDASVIVAYRSSLAADCALVLQRSCLYVFLLQTPNFGSGSVSPATTESSKPTAAAATTALPVVSNKENHIGGGTVFFIVVCLLVVGYFVCGALYKRLVLGAQGVEQIPNYLLFRRCCRRVQALSDQWRGGERSGHESYRHYAEDLSYDQPPLTVTVSSGNDYNPVISHGQSRTPPEADERLIQP